MKRRDDELHLAAEAHDPLTRAQWSGRRCLGRIIASYEKNPWPGGAFGRSLGDRPRAGEYALCGLRLVETYRPDQTRTWAAVDTNDRPATGESSIEVLYATGVDKVFNNGVWAIQKLRAAIPEGPFQVLVDGKSIGTTKLLAIARRVPNTDRFPQILVLYASGYLRLKAGADPAPPLPFGQSLVLGPAIWGTSTSFPRSTLLFHPQLQRVAIDTSSVNRGGTNRLLIRITGSNAKLPPDSRNTNRVMNLAWTLTLDEPTDHATMLDVAGTFELMEEVIPDRGKTAEAQSVRLLQISTMFIDRCQHDVDALRFRNAAGLVTVYYDPDLANLLLPATPSALHPQMPMFDSLHTDAVGQPNGNTPSYRITLDSTQGPTSGPITVRAFFNRSQNRNDDNLWLGAFQQPPERFKRGTMGRIDYTVTASTGPLPARDFAPTDTGRDHNRGLGLADRKR